MSTADPGAGIDRLNALISADLWREGAEEFFQNGEDAIHLSQQPRHNELMPCEDVCLGMQFDTMLAYNELLRSRPWTAQLSAIAEDHGLPARLAARRTVA